jgi:hypothetical protein
MPDISRPVSPHAALTANAGSRPNCERVGSLALNQGVAELRATGIPRGLLRSMIRSDQSIGACSERLAWLRVPAR